MKWAIVITGVLFNALASVLAKTAPPLTLTAPLTNLGNWKLGLSLFCYGVSFILYTMALQRMPLNLAHPVSTAGAIVLVGLVSALLFGEAFSALRLAGYACLFIGICLLAYSDLGAQR